MSRGELFTRLTIWIAIAGYAIGVAAVLLFPDRLKWRSGARLAWTAGCLGLIVHAICAFHFYHDWSHISAYRETARQTAEVTGAKWGGGLFINYFFLAAWIADVIWWWRGDDSYRRRHWLITAIWQAIFIFIIFNATVVFKTGPVRWLGLALCLAMGFIWLISDGRRRLAVR